ncbi:uncharacterized protein LOC125665211 [Ostrea edulis]|uniref:uncharacterized protein LOC125665211 n=1 Tax=Ostrea edulis TaxID=37623 RepID=UPI002094D176|nr:uncharacterized protein LOC125665211 [Ostrea edulis]
MDFKVLEVCVVLAVIHGLGIIVGIKIPQPVNINNSEHSSETIVHPANVTPSYALKHGSGGVTRIIRRIHRASFVRPQWMILVELGVLSSCSLIVIGLLGYFGRTCYKRLTASKVRGKNSRQSTCTNPMKLGIQM